MKILTNLCYDLINVHTLLLLLNNGSSCKNKPQPTCRKKVTVLKHTEEVVNAAISPTNEMKPRIPQ